MTGNEAAFGLSTHRGLSLAIDEANAESPSRNGDRYFRLVVYDDSGTRTGAAEAVEHLVTVDSAVVLVGEVSSSLSLAGGAVAQRLGVPMVSPSSTHAMVTTIGDRVFRACVTDAHQGTAAAAFAAGPLKARTAVVLSDPSSTYSQALAVAFQSAFPKRGGRVVEALTYQYGDTDFRPQLKAIRRARPDVVFLPGLYPDVVSITVAARDRGLDVTFVGGDGWDSTGLAEAAGAAIEVGHDAGRMVVDALRRAPSTDGADLAQALATVRELATVTGPLTVGPDREASRPLVMMQLRGGRPVWAATLPAE